MVQNSRGERTTIFDLGGPGVRPELDDRFGPKPSFFGNIDRFGPNRSMWPTSMVSARVHQTVVLRHTDCFGPKTVGIGHTDRFWSKAVGVTHIGRFRPSFSSSSSHWHSDKPYGSLESSLSTAARTALVAVLKRSFRALRALPC